MEERRLGTLGPRVSSVSLGCMSIAGAYGPTTEEEAMRLLERAVDLGVTHFDTADIYGMGISEEILGRFLKQRRLRVSIASKGGIRYMRATGERFIDNSPGYLATAIDNSLRRLGVDRIDIYYIHRLDPQRPIEEVVGALGRLKRAGKIGAIGLSEVSAQTLRRAHREDRITAVQSEYSLCTRLPEREILDTTEELGIGFVAFAPLSRGLLTATPPDVDSMTPRDFRRKNPRFSLENLSRNLEAAVRFRDLCQDMGHDPASVSIAYILAQGRHIVAIPGTRSPENLEASIKGASLRLSQADCERIVEVFPEGFPWGSRYSKTQGLGVEELA
ncbi:MAG: aldo/keto reductase [Alphaproteobacteria bacterium]|nr:aldo/keto reductase [Alphaproteobacteria bacterium]